jgi:putative molybdopterin biosynthesis protein
MMTKKTEKEFYLVEELAAKLRITHMTIYRYIKAGRLKAYKIGKDFRIDRAEFDKFLDKTRTK